MTSLLYIPPLPRHNPLDGFLLKKAEMDVHTCAMRLLNEVREDLPESAQRHACSATIVGLTTAIGRILASAENQVEVAQTIERFSKAVAVEHRYWMGSRALLH